MLALKLAYRNLVGAGLRTWLNVFVLSLSYVVIIWHQGLLQGWNRQAKRDMIQWEMGGGQFWHQNYDPYDPFTIQDAHGDVSRFQEAIDEGNVAPILITQATMYPQGRAQNVMLKGIPPNQSILALPTDLFEEDGATIPVLIGRRTARDFKLEEGDLVTIRWRDAKGVFDAAEARVIGIYKTTVPTADLGQMWLPVERLRTMLGMKNEATLLVLREDAAVENYPGWIFQDHDFLLADINQTIKAKSIGGSIAYFLLLMLALLAVFDTQVLSIFRRQREIGTDIALGMTRGQVVRLFTIEGAMHAILAAILAAVYGIPLLSWQARTGFAVPGSMDDYGMAVGERLFPAYSLGLVLTTTLFVLIAATIVSYIPATKITRMKPTDAIRGKIQ